MSTGPAKTIHVRTSVHARVGLRLFLLGMVFALLAVFASESPSTGEVPRVMWVHVVVFGAAFATSCRIRLRVTSEAVFVRNPFRKIEARFDDPSVCFVVPGTNPSATPHSPALVVRIGDAEPVVAWASECNQRGKNYGDDPLGELEQVLRDRVCGAKVRLAHQVGDPGISDDGYPASRFPGLGKS